VGRGNVRVASGNDLAVGALGVGHRQETNHLCDGVRRRASGHEVASDSSSVWAADTLDPDLVGAVFPLKSAAERVA
jgi:hypothetical protein